ncbi:signal peptidase I [Bailinhaonella thermotolerans]|uniref:Signal peptidase I n=1 Tax=Bailinhaonella thermotolerans TaxID=1070861 RepID=A0A3A4AKZ3_9ACTN|nr:signal peptidase I [Bailinhaonella thermotolerans]
MPAIAVVVVLCAVLVNAFVVQVFWIPSASMEDTLLEGDRVLVGKLGDDYGRQDVVVFSGVFGPDDKDFIKRVIAVGGDTVECCDARGRLMVNGRPLTEPYIQPGNRPSATPFRAVVPPGRLWVMGDHRDDSADSRYHQRLDGDGTVPVDKVVGRAFMIIWPPSRVGGL